MKKVTLTLVILVASLSAYAQDITGDWYGLLKVQGLQLRLVFHITGIGDSLKASLDSPDQNALGIPVTSTSLENDVLKMTVTNLAIEYTGTLDKDSIVGGTFKQGGQSFPMNLSRAPVEKGVTTRPQEPKKPYPYREEEVIFTNTKDKITLAGTLTLPKEGGRYPAAILITGSGPQNRDEELMGHKPFLVLADHLTRNGIAVLRFDDRGAGGSTGTFATATSADFATDVEAAIEFLKSREEIIRIGLVGHSEGGLIAPMVGSRSTDVNFVVMLAGPGVRGKELLMQQAELIGRAMGMSEELVRNAHAINEGVFDLVLKSERPDSLRSQLTSSLRKAARENPQMVAQTGMPEETFITAQVNQLSSPWMTWFIRYDPAPTLAKVTCPLLALLGEKDLQVPASSNLKAIQGALQKSGNKNATVKVLPNLNHLFQEAQTGSPAEYATIEQTFSPLALNEISEWILMQK